MKTINIFPYIQLIRPRQWIKNLFVAAPLLFSSKLLDIPSIINVCCAFIIFCLTASSIYIINDIRDIHSDRQHTKNRFRPLASGSITVSNAFILLLFLCCLVISFASITLYFGYLSWNFFGLVFLYLCINISYSFGLKNIALLEMFLVASGYVIRVIAGCAAIFVTPSPWIIVVSGVVSMLIVVGKRRAETIACPNLNKKRKSIHSYNVTYLDSLISIFGCATIITYMLFTLSEQTIQKHHTENLIYTSVFVVYGITRYILLVKVRDGAESPTDLVMTDPGISLSVILWVISLIYIMYL